MATAEGFDQRGFQSYPYHTEGQTESLDMLSNDFIEGIDGKIFKFVDNKNLRGKVWIMHSGNITSKNIKFNRDRFFIFF